MPKARAKRPKSTKGKYEKMFSLRLTEREYAALQHEADRYHITPAEYVRVMAFAKVHAQELGERMRALNSIAGGPGAATLVEQEPIWRLAAIVNDALKAVADAEETTRVMKGLLVPGMLEIKRVLEEQGFIPSGEPTATGGKP